jgi:predicted XRE-type DNA-binding protein
MKRKLSSAALSKALNISPTRGMEAAIKAQLITAIIKAVQKHKFTHMELSERSGLPRSAVTGILSGSLQKVTIDRVLRLAEAARLQAEVRVKDAA